MEPPTDAEAIDRVRAGEIDAFAGIIRRHQQDVWRIAAHALRDVSATEDLVQQVFVKVYLNLDSYRPVSGAGGGAGPWIRTIARNEVRKLIRSEVRDARKRRLYGDWLAARLEQQRDDAAEASDPHLREALQRCREALAPAASQALVMRYERALSFDEIAAALQRTVAATRQLLSRTRVALRKCIETRTGQPGQSRTADA